MTTKTLTTKQKQFLVSACIDPQLPEPNDKLKKAAKRYSDAVKEVRANLGIPPCKISTANENAIEISKTKEVITKIIKNLDK